MINVAIVGIGWAGTRHAEAILELNRKLRVECLVDNDAAHLEAKASELGVSKTYTALEDALADPAVDAMSICTPHPLHRPMAIDAADAGKHILVEKPMAQTVADATRMLDAACANHVKLYVAENATYTPMARFLQQVVEKREPIGNLTSASVSAGFRAPDFGYPGRRSWLTALEEGGTGTWMLHGIHTMAQMRFVLGEVSTVYMHEHKAPGFRRPDLEGTMSGLMTLESGLSVSVLQTCESKVYSELSGYLLHGETGSMRATASGYWLYSDETASSPPVKQSFPASPLSDYALEMEAFADYVNGTATGPTTGESERRTLAIVQAGYESAQSGQPVHIAPRFGEL